MQSKRTVVVLLAAVGLLLVLVASIALLADHVMGSSEHDCNTSWADEIRSEMSQEVPLGTERSKVKAFAVSKGWDVRIESNPLLLTAEGFTHCGLGSADRSEIRFAFDVRQRLASIEVATGLPGPGR